MDLFVDVHLFSPQLLVHRRQSEAMCVWIVQNVQNGQELWHIKGRLPWESFIEVPEVIQIIDSLAFNTV